MSYIGNPPSQVAFLTDQFSGTGSQTAFTMSVAPAGTTSMLVSVTGVLQDPTTYSVVGTTLTFSAAPPSGTGNISVRYLGIPASGVTTTAYRTVTEFTATAGQTTFTPPSYTVGFINVYRNGVRLGSADFTASNGTTVVLTNAATVGDLVVTESFYVSSVLNAIPATAGSVSTSYLVDASVTTAKIADANVTPAKLSQPLTLSTAQASTSGTSIDFTSIPSWVKRITVMFKGVSTNGTSPLLIQIGAGSVTSSGYNSNSWTANTSNTSSTLGFIQQGVNSAPNLAYGISTICSFGSNAWVEAHSLGGDVANDASVGGGAVTLGGALDRVRITTVNGTDTFDAGSINILYE